MITVCVGSVLGQHVCPVVCYRKQLVTSINPTRETAIVCFCWSLFPDVGPQVTKTFRQTGGRAARTQQSES